MMKRPLLIIAFLLCACVTVSGESTVLLAGSDKMLVRKLSDVLTVMLVENEYSIDIEKGKVLVLAADETLPSEYRLPVDRFLRSGGHVIFVGASPMRYEPRFDPTNPIPWPADLKVFRPKRVKSAGSTDQPEVREIVHEGRKGVEFRTTERGMRDEMFELPFAQKPAGDDVIVFRARGSHFMDLLPVEIRDRDGKQWYTFVPLGVEWREYAVSLADFIPEGWNDPDKPYPLLDPSRVVSLFMGMNTMAVWSEKVMSFAVAGIATAKGTGSYTPSSRLKTLRLPFEQIGIAVPAWIVDPFYGGDEIADAEIMSQYGNISFRKVRAQAPSAICLPPAYYEHPGSGMGTDHKKSVADKRTRMMRVEPLLTDAQGRRIGEFVQYGRGRYAGGSAAFIGVKADIPGIANLVAEVAQMMIDMPRVAGFSITTTDLEKTGRVRPVVLVELLNPRERISKGKLTVDFNTKLRSEIDLSLHPFALKQYRVELPDVPEDFPMSDFTWEIVFTTQDYADAVRDRCDVERAMIAAMRHLVRTQRLYPDGRISNHYFGDAYGVRAMLAYTDLLDREPERIKRNRDLWATVSPDDIRACGERFFDMLVERQLPNGAWPMGYSEHSRVYNVADCGQMGISIGQSLRYVRDPARRERYLASLVKYGRWAENYYIDQARSDRMKIEKPEEYAKGDARVGFYGLGPAGRKERLTGPVWVLADIIGSQIALARESAGDEAGFFRKIADRNSQFYVRGKFPAPGYFQAEVLNWIRFDTPDPELKALCRETLAATFIPPLCRGVELDMYDMGSRATLKALPLIYYMRQFGGDAATRAVLLKYVWSFASPSYVNSMENQSENMPRPVHGESIATAKYAACSALWGMELLVPGSTLPEEFR